jgi:hypothetical protein
MTWAREPMSMQQAVLDAVEVLGWPALCKVVGLSERAIRKWSEPACNRYPPADIVLAIDLACIRAGVPVPPFQAIFDLHYQMAKAQASVAIATRAERLAAALSEVGEAFAHQTLAMAPGADPRTRTRVRQETQEAIVALARLGDGFDG